MSIEDLNRFPVQLEIPVQWGDMDSANHVNNTIYLRWTESSRIAYFKKIGIDDSFQSEAGPILGWHDCKYIFPLIFPDTAIVTCKTLEIKEDRILLLSHIYSKTHKRIAAISTQTIIPYNYILFKKTAIPQKWINSISSLEEQ